MPDGHDYNKEYGSHDYPDVEGREDRGAHHAQQGVTELGLHPAQIDSGITPALVVRPLAEQFAVEVDLPGQFRYPAWQGHHTARVPGDGEQIRHVETDYDVEEQLPWFEDALLQSGQSSRRQI